MSASVADPRPEDVPPGPASGRSSPPPRAWALALVAGLVAGLGAWIALELTRDRLQPGLLNTPGIPTAEEANAAAVARAGAYAREATLAFGALGAALGLALGAAGGLATASTRRALTAAASGVALGALLGAAAARLLAPVFYRWYDPDADSIALAIAIQSGIAAAIGAAGGAAFGLGVGGRPRAVRAALGGLLGAILGVVLFQVLGALAFPLDATSKPISATAPTRLLARLAVSIFASAGALYGASPWPATADRSRRAPQ